MSSILRQKAKVRYLRERGHGLDMLSEALKCSVSVAKAMSVWLDYIEVKNRSEGFKKDIEFEARIMEKVH